MSAPITLEAAAAFAWHEADLLDRHDYLPWLELWTPGGRYVVPVDRDAGDDHAARLNIAYDDAAMREARVKRLRSGFSMSAAPPARTVRTVSRFVALPGGEGFAVRAAQHIVEFKYERTRVLAADVTYRLMAGDGGLRLHEKVIRLINSDGALHGIGYLF